MIGWMRSGAAAICALPLLLGGCARKASVGQTALESTATGSLADAPEAELRGCGSPIYHTTSPSLIAATGDANAQVDYSSEGSCPGKAEVQLDEFKFKSAGGTISADSVVATQSNPTTMPQGNANIVISYKAKGAGDLPTDRFIPVALRTRYTLDDPNHPPHGDHGFGFVIDRTGNASPIAAKLGHGLYQPGDPVTITFTFTNSGAKATETGEIVTKQFYHVVGTETLDCNALFDLDTAPAVAIGGKSCTAKLKIKDGNAISQLPHGRYIPVVILWRFPWGDGSTPDGPFACGFVIDAGEPGQRKPPKHAGHKD